MKHILTLALLALLLAACGQKAPKLTARQQQAQAAREEREALKIGVLPTLDCLPVYLLRDSLLYDSAKADIRLKVFTAQMDIDTALVGTSVQVAVSDMVRAAHLGRRGTYLKALTATPAYWQLYTHPDEKIDSIRKLQDKTIGMTRHSVTDLLNVETMRKAKLASPAFPAQINDVYLRLKMLRSDQIEAAWLTEPQATQAKLAGMKLLVDNSKEASRMGAIVYHENPMDDLTKRARQMDAFKEAYNKACQLINEKGIPHFAPLLKKYMGLDEKTINALPKLRFNGITTPRSEDVRRAKDFR